MAVFQFVAIIFIKEVLSPVEGEIQRLLKSEIPTLGE